MNDDFEKLLMNMPLSQPSAELDAKIDAIIASSELKVHRQKNLVKFLTYAAAASLFLAIGVAEIYRRTRTVPELTSTQTPKSVKAETAIKVSTSESTDNILQGEIIQLENGMLVRPVVRQVIVKKIYYDSKTNTQVVVEQPYNEVFYVPLKAD